MTDIQAIIKKNRSALNDIIALRRAMHSISKVETTTIKKHDITITQFAVLEILYNKGQLRIQDLIEKMLTTSGNMTVVIKNMVRDGWITREPNPEDKRASLINLTDKGRTFIEGILPEHYENVGRIFSILTENERRDLVAILKKFKDLS